MGVEKATIQDIARALNVTASTVSRALSGHAGISDATKLAVRRTAKKLQYTPNRVASSLRLGKTRIVGVIIPSAEINFFGSVVHGIEKVASENDYHVLLYQSNERSDVEKEGVETFLRARVDGILASLSKETTNFAHYKEIRRRGVPLVFFDRVNDAIGVPSVVVNDYLGAYKATQHLIDQGCRRIAHVAGQQHVGIFSERFKGYKDALAANALPFDPDLVKYGKVTIESGTLCMNELLQLPSAPDGVFAVEDFTALGCIQALKAASKMIPDDVAVIGFANESFGEYITPSLSTVDQQTIKMGETAARLFFDHGSKTSFYTSSPLKTVLDPVLIFRNSSLRNA